MRFCRPLALSLVGLVGVVACDGSNESAPAPGGASSATQVAPQKTPALPVPTAPAALATAAALPASDAKATEATPYVLTLARARRAAVKLEDPGRGQRHELRYALQSGAEQAFSIQMNIEPSLKVAGKKAPGSAGMQFDVSGKLRLLSVGEDGDARRRANFERFVPTSTGLTAADLARLQAQFGALEGLVLEDTFSSRGEQSAAQVILPTAPTSEAAAFLQTLGDSMSNAFLPLPLEAVGLGARWTSEEKIVAEGVEATQTNTFVLQRLSTAELAVEVTVSQVAPSQALESEHLPPGVSVRLTSLSGTGKGQISIHRQTLAAASSLTMNLVVETEVTSPNAKKPISSSTSTAMKLKIRVTGQPAPKG